MMGICSLSCDGEAAASHSLNGWPSWKPVRTGQGSQNPPFLQLLKVENTPKKNTEIGSRSRTMFEKMVQRICVAR